MRFSKSFTAMLMTGVVLAMAAPSFGQGPGRGMMGGRGMMAQIGEDMNVTEEQSTQIQTAMREMWQGAMQEFQGLSEDERREKMGEMRTRMEEKFAEILTPEQVTRGDEIRIQLEGARSFARPKIQEKLGLTEEQVAQMEAVGTRLREKFQELGEIARSGDAAAREGLREQLEELGKRGETAAFHILTEEQRAQFEEMKGEPFEYVRPEPGAGRPGTQRPGQQNDFEYDRVEREESTTTEGRNNGAFPQGGDTDEE